MALAVEVETENIRHRRIQLVINGGADKRRQRRCEESLLRCYGRCLGIVKRSFLDSLKKQWRPSIEHN